MKDTEASARCRAACVDLTAGREPGPLAPVEAVALRQLLRVHALSGLGAAALETGALRVPDRVGAGIVSDWRSAQATAAELDRECERIGAAALSMGAGLRAPIVLKGPAVARRYRDPPVRTYSDIDLLVATEEMRAWAEVLVALGYWGPPPELAMAERRYQEGVAFGRRAGATQLICDLHGCVFIERRAREFTYPDLAPHSQPGPFPGLLQPTPAAELVVLALHLAHHDSAVVRLIWIRDFIELGQPTVVVAARELACRHDLGWALERALAAAEDVIGKPRWAASPPGRESFGLASVHQEGRTQYLRHLALAHELGVPAALRYFASRISPRRFPDRGTAGVWIRLAGRRMRATRWLRWFQP